MSKADSGNNDKLCRLKLNSWKPVPKWQVRIDYLVSEGWLSQLPEFYDGEQWKEANEE
jgi:hypothetical protein